MNVNNDDSLSLPEAKNRLLNIIDRNLSIHDIRNMNSGISNFESDAVYFHILLLFHTPNDVDLFLRSYFYTFGPYVTEMFINYPLVDIENRRNMTPLDCAMLWNNDPYLIRLLYQWGANFGALNVDLNFVEEINNIPYRNYLSHYRLHNNNNINNNYISFRRNTNEFTNIINEVSYIVGEASPHIDWQYPQRHFWWNNNNQNQY
jgi:hypothetical protein